MQKKHAGLKIRFQRVEIAVPAREGGLILRIWNTSKSASEAEEWECVTVRVS